MHSQERDIILDSITEGVFTVDRYWRITSFNKAAETITGIYREEALGHRYFEEQRRSLVKGTIGCKL